MQSVKMNALCLFLPFLCLLGPVFAQYELLQNPGMEDDFNGNWKCAGGCILESSWDSYSGTKSASISARPKTWAGIKQDVTLPNNTHYRITAYIKFLSLPSGAFYERTQVKVSCKRDDGSNYVQRFGTDPKITLGEWIQIGDVYKILEGTGECSVSIDIESIEVDYLIDDFSIVKVPVNPNILDESNANIEALRKSEICLSMSGITEGNYTVRLQQTAHLYPFGAALYAPFFNDTTTYKAYQDVFFDNFNWAAISNKLKWKQMEKVEGEPDTETPMKLINILTERNIPIRGHPVMWSKEDNQPPWVVALKDDYDRLKNVTDKRVNEIVTLTKGLLAHWDVMNELLHGDWFEQYLKDANYSLKLFNRVHELDPFPELFLNDFGIVRGDYAMAYKHQADYFQRAGLPIHGAGIQSHLKADEGDLTVIKGRLDIVAEAGLQIFITELTIEQMNATLKAEMFREVLTLYFGHPAVKGIILWGYWDGKIMEDSAKLFEGPNAEPNEAGQVYLDLYHDTWRSSKTWRFYEDGSKITRGFHGDYSLKLKRNDELVDTTEFKLGADGVDILIELDVTGTPTFTISDL